jgi:phosphate transport system permease protein
LAVSLESAPAPAGGRQPLPSPPERPRLSVRDWAVRLLAFAPALVPAGIVLAILVVLVSESHFTIFPGFFTSNFESNYASPTNQWGILVFVTGSFLTALPAIAFAIAVGLGLGIATTTYLPRGIAALLDPFVDLLAGIPSIIYGIWGFVVIGPYLGLTVNPWLSDHLSFLPGFGGDHIQQSGQGLPLPITTLLIRDALRSVPKDLWESGLALGATRWEVVRRVAIPHSRRGIISAGFLGFGRAFGETVAVAMVIGGVAAYPTNVFGQTNTMAAQMFGQSDAALGNPNLLQWLAEIAILLLAISLIVNIVGRRLIAGLSTEQISGL